MASNITTTWRKVAASPVVKSALTSCVVLTAGDCVSQYVERRTRSQRVSQDWKRTARFTLLGLTLHGPYFHHGFRFVEKLMGPTSTWKGALSKTMAAQVIIFPPWLVLFFSYMGIAEGKGVKGSIEKVKSGFLPSFTVGTAFWPTVNVFNFMYCPLEYRVAYVSIVGVIWNAYMSWVNASQSAVLKRKQR